VQTLRVCPRPPAYNNGGCGQLPNRVRPLPYYTILANRVGDVGVGNIIIKMGGADRPPGLIPPWTSMFKTDEHVWALVVFGS
jgi:hypothetical protein